MDLETTAPILVTGATGHVGRALVDALLAAGRPVRALVRDPDRAALPAGVDVRRGDLGDPATVRAAAGGAGAAFLLWAVADHDTAEEVVAALATTGRVVYLSAILDADATGPIPESHRLLERLVGAGRSETTMVRGGGFATNTLGWAPEVRSGSVVREAFGGIPRPLVHERDLAAVAAHALLTDDLVGATPEVTGPAVVSGAEQVAAISAAIGRPVRMHALDHAAAAARVRGWGLDEEAANAVVEAWARMVERPEQPTGTVEGLLGRPALSYATWASDHADDFR